MFAPLSQTQAAPASRFCQQLEAQLASAGKGGSRDVRRYESAIRKQQSELDAVRARASGCTGPFAGLRSQCASIRQTISRMQSNLQSLKATRDRMSGGGNVAAERQRIREAMRASGCGTDRRPAVREVRREPSRHTNRNMEPAPARNPAISRPTGTPARTGHFRTMCVRACDGYYFPISSSTSASSFEQDAAACEALCPDTQVELYYHRFPGQESDQMVSAKTGQPYADAPSAFLYRQQNYQRPASCGCGVPQPSRNFTVIAGESPAEKPAATITAPSLPVSDPAADPEAQANMEGGLDKAALLALLAPKYIEAKAEQTPDDATRERTVRVVGPAFLPDL